MENKNILSVDFNETTGVYSVSASQGSSVAELAFAVAVVAKCMVRDEVIPDADIFVELIRKYIEDPQYEEQSMICNCGEMLHYDESLGRWKCDSCGYMTEVSDA